MATAVSAAPPPPSRIRISKKQNTEILRPSADGLSMTGSFIPPRVGTFGGPPVPLRLLDMEHLVNRDVAQCLHSPAWPTDLYLVNAPGQT
jgi:hypothetical protein